MSKVSPTANDTFGLFRALGSLSLSQVFKSSDFILAGLLSIAGAVLIKFHVPDVTKHLGLVDDALVVSSQVFGVVLAGFAIVAALLGDRYSRLLAKSGATTYDMLRHFLVVAGLFLTSIVMELAYGIGAEPLHRESADLELAALGVTVFFCLWALLSTLGLMKLILGVAVTSVAATQLTDDGHPMN